MKYIKFTEKQFNNMTESELKRLIWITGDSQGDTTSHEFFEMKEDWGADWEEAEYSYPDPGKMTTMEFINTLYENTNGNMSHFLWIENNECFKVSFA